MLRSLIPKMLLRLCEKTTSTTRSRRMTILTALRSRSRLWRSNGGDRNGDQPSLSRC
ncbi:unnamed protein product [Linum tenue]|uniref:Uncharacterized protein n=1 Tax=Linum tenue TaxID=586396 RepID=A0AAV0QM26_9ROSI|nr:unnamed protein product [Linum tenue]